MAQIKNLKKKVVNLKKYFETHWLILILCVALLIFIQAFIEFSMGRLAICKCGYVLLWYNNTNGHGNSQHLFDWYSFSHIIHGVLFYGILWLFARRLPVKTRFLLAVLMECAWEVFENSPFVIDRYRTATFAFDYYGDSIINSVFDVFSMCLGFILSRKLPVKLTITLVIVLELFTVYMVRDNLTLNFITLIHPIEFVADWQAAAPNMAPMNLSLFPVG